MYDVFLTNGEEFKADDILFKNDIGVTFYVGKEIEYFIPWHILKYITKKRK